MSKVKTPKVPAKKKKDPLAPPPPPRPRRRNVSEAAAALIGKLQKAMADMRPGSFSVSFQELDKTAWLSSVVGVGAIDKHVRGVAGGRKMKAILMVRVTGSGTKSNAAGERTKRVPAYGMKPVIARSLADVEKLLEHGPEKAKAAYAARRKSGKAKKAAPKKAAPKKAKKAAPKKAAPKKASPKKAKRARKVKASA